MSMSRWLIEQGYPEDRLETPLSDLPSKKMRPEWWLVRRRIDWRYWSTKIQRLRDSEIVSHIDEIYFVDTSFRLDEIDWGGIGMIQHFPESLLMLPHRHLVIPGDEDKWDAWREEDEGSEDLLTEIEYHTDLCEDIAHRLIAVEQFESLSIASADNGWEGDRCHLWDWKSTARHLLNFRSERDKKYAIRDAIRETLEETIEDLFEGLLDKENGNPTW